MGRKAEANESGSHASALAVWAPVADPEPPLRDRRPDAPAWFPMPLPAELQEQLQRVWMRLGPEWSSLAVVSGDPDTSMDPLADALSGIGSRLSPQPVRFVRASELDLERAASIVRRMSASAGEKRQTASFIQPKSRTLVSLESPLTNPLALSVAHAADGVVLCIRRRHAELEAIRRTVEAVGADRLVCCLVLD